MRPGRGRRPDHRPQVSGVLDAVQGHEEGGGFAGGRGTELLGIRIRHRSHQGGHPLVDGA